MSSETLGVGDYCVVTEAFRDIPKGSTWRIDSVESHNDWCSDPDECECTDFGTYYSAASTDGMRSTDLEADKVEELTEDIPFNVYAEVVSEVYGRIYATSEAEAISKVKKNPSEILDNMTEMTQRARIVHTEGF